MKNTLKNPYVYFMFIVPTIALYGLFFIWPMLTSAYYAFTDYVGLEGYKYVGWDNFDKAFGDPDFVASIKRNLIFIVFSVFIQVPLIIFFSLLIGNVKKFQGFYKTTVFMPSILSTSVIGILWGYIYHPDIGLLNNILQIFGVDPVYWLAETRWPLPLLSILITNAWQWMGFYIVLILAAIFTIPKEINEAAEIDGATGMQKAVHLTVPLIRPIISVVVMLSIAGALRVVDIVLVMTNGGPAGETDVMASFMVNQSLTLGQYGYATAITMIIFAFALVLTGLYQLSFGKQSERIEY
ncbi:MAG: sugar ABC transporter permease [Cohnella sp.]|nr:sugar ABC transporter permease [Cohnella sp.]